MVGWWPLDETSGTTASDYDPFPQPIHNGVYEGSPTWLPGMVGNALRLNGSTDGVRIRGGPFLCNGMTVDAWIYPRSFPTDPGPENGAMICGEYSAEIAQAGFLALMVTSTGQFCGNDACHR